PTHTPVSVWDSDDVLVHQVVSMYKMKDKQGHVRPESGFYAKLNAIKFVPRMELSREQAYWLNSQDHTPSKPVTPFVRKGPPPSQVLASLHLVKLKDQLQGKDKTIRNLQAQHDIVSVLNVGPTDGRKALETELTQLKDTITALRIQNDGFKVTNAIQKTDIAKLKAKDVGNKSPKYIIPHRRTNMETPIPMSRKKHVTFKEPPKPSPRVTKKPVAPQVKKANVVVHLSTGIKSATGASKTASKNHA
nr:hypothetical protein [Tanacetum cinerariifolium]